MNSIELYFPFTGKGLLQQAATNAYSLLDWGQWRFLAKVNYCKLGKEILKMTKFNNILRRNGSRYQHAWVYADVVFVVGSGGKRLSAVRVCTMIGPLSRVCADMNLPDVRRSEGTITPLKRTLEWLLSCKLPYYSAWDVVKVLITPFKQALEWLLSLIL